MEGGVGGGDSHGSARRLSVLRGHLSAGARTVAAVQASGTSSSYSAPVSSSKDERQRAYPRKRWAVAGLAPVSLLPIHVQTGRVW